MATLQAKIQEAFFAKLTEAGTVDPQRIERLRNIMESGKFKVDDVVKAFSPSDDLK